MNINEKALFQITGKIVKKWKKILCLDPIWSIYVELVEGAEMEGAIARVNTANTEYFSATIEITDQLLGIDEGLFTKIMNSTMCHELIHIVAIDFYRTAQLLAGDNVASQKEIRYKYEQFTSRLQKAFSALEEKPVKKVKVEEPKEVKLPELKSKKEKK